MTKRYEEKLESQNEQLRVALEEANRKLEEPLIVYTIMRYFIGSTGKGNHLRRELKQFSCVDNDVPNPFDKMEESSETFAIHKSLKDAVRHICMNKDFGSAVHKHRLWTIKVSSVSDWSQEDISGDPIGTFIIAEDLKEAKFVEGAFMMYERCQKLYGEVLVACKQMVDDFPAIRDEELAKDY